MTWGIILFQYAPSKTTLAKSILANLFRVKIVTFSSCHDFRKPPSDCSDFRQLTKTSERCRSLLKMIYNLCLFVQQYCLTDQLRKELIQPVLAISSHELCKIKRVHKLTNVSKQSGHSESKVPFIIASHHA